MSLTGVDEFWRDTPLRALPPAGFRRLLRRLIFAQRVHHLLRFS